MSAFQTEERRNQRGGATRATGWQFHCANLPATSSGEKREQIAGGLEVSVIKGENIFNFSVIRRVIDSGSMLP